MDKEVIVQYRRNYKEHSELCADLDAAKAFIDELENEVGGYAYRIKTTNGTPLLWREHIPNTTIVRWIEVMNDEYRYRETV